MCRNVHFHSIFSAVCHSWSMAVSHAGLYRMSADQKQNRTKKPQKTALFGRWNRLRNIGRGHVNSHRRTVNLFLSKKYKSELQEFTCDEVDVCDKLCWLIPERNQRVQEMFSQQLQSCTRIELENLWLVLIRLKGQSILYKMCPSKLSCLLKISGNYTVTMLKRTSIFY